MTSDPSTPSETDPVDLACRLTLVLLAVSDWVGGERWIYGAPLRILAIAGLIVPGLFRSPWLWRGLAAVAVVRSVDNWWLQDNHLFLLTYWLVALAVGLRLPAPREPLRTCARLLIGGSFLFATIWKVVLSEDFTSGAYFHYTFLTDPRFFDWIALVTRVDVETPS